MRIAILRAFNSMARWAGNHLRTILETTIKIVAATSVLTGTARVYLTVGLSRIPFMSKIAILVLRALTWLFNRIAAWASYHPRTILELALALSAGVFVSVAVAVFYLIHLVSSGLKQ